MLQEEYPNMCEYPKWSSSVDLSKNYLIGLVASI